MAVGPPFGPLAGGWVFDTFGAYTWLYVVSLAIGFGAAGIALTFRPTPRKQEDVSLRLKPVGA